MQHFSYVTPTFSYRIEQCSNSSKFLVREKSRKRNDDTRTSFLYQVCHTRKLDRLSGALKLDRLSGALVKFVKSGSDNEVGCESTIDINRLVKDIYAG